MPPSRLRQKWDVRDEPSSVHAQSRTSTLKFMEKTSHRIAIHFYPNTTTTWTSSRYHPLPSKKDTNFIVFQSSTRQIKLSSSTQRNISEMSSNITSKMRTTMRRKKRKLPFSISSQDQLSSDCLWRKRRRKRRMRRKWRRKRRVRYEWHGKEDMKMWWES